MTWIAPWVAQSGLKTNRCRSVRAAASITSRRPVRSTTSATTRTTTPHRRPVRVRGTSDG
jgi:hypothetical protein